MRGFVAAIGLVALTMSGAQAWTFDGYMTAGGVGRLKCTEYQNTLAEARAVGLLTQAGFIKMNPFTQYAMGYYTHYNQVSPGIYDLLDGIRGDEFVVSILTVLDNWCRDNPIKDFDDALVKSVEVFLPTAKLEAQQ